MADSTFPDVRYCDVSKCSACGHNHAHLLFKRFAVPHLLNGEEWEWSSICPDTNLTILMNERRPGQTTAETASSPRAGWLKPWSKCRYCSMSEDAHAVDCPGDAPALLARVKELEKFVKIMANVLTEGK